MCRMVHSSVSLFLNSLIARRYFFSRKQKTVINVISWISLVGIAVSTTALVVVLSVYNGIGNLTQTLFNSFDPPLLVQPAKGKTFRLSESDLETLSHLGGVATVSQIVEENAWVTYRHNEAIVSLRGVDDNYPLVTGLDTLLYEGAYVLKGIGEAFVGEQAWASNAVEDSSFDTYTYFLLFGAEVYYNLGIREVSNVPVAVHIPKRGVSLGFTMEEAFNTGYAMPGGNFYIQVNPAAELSAAQQVQVKYALLGQNDPAHGLLHLRVRRLVNDLTGGAQKDVAGGFEDKETDYQAGQGVQNGQPHPCSGDADQRPDGGERIRAMVPGVSHQSR